MSQVDPVTERWIEAYRQVETGLPGRDLPWMARLRAEAVERFGELGLPTLRHEAWKYTDVKPIAKRQFTPAPEARLAAHSIRPYLLDGVGAHRLVFIDGHFAPELSELQALPEGVTVKSLAAALTETPEAVEEHLGRYADSAAHGFAALNAALLRDGAYVHIARRVAVETPIQLLFIASGAADVAAHIRNLIVAEENSQAAVVEAYVSAADARYLTNATTEIVAGNNASVEHYKLGRESEQAYHVGGLHVHQNRDSRFTSHNVAAGARLMRTDLGAVLDDEGIECNLNGLYLTHGRQHVDNFTRIDHRKPNSTSREWYKGVLDEHSRSVFTGRVVVHRDAQHSDAQQANNNLLLSDGAEADSRPQLEIYADDVKCAHGSTVGQLDPDEMFYLRSRGMDYELARSLLVYAFAADLLQRMKLAPVRAQLEQELTGKLLHGQSVKELQ